MAKRRFALHVIPALAAALAAVASPCVNAGQRSQTHIHGFFSQAAVVSDGNNIAGNSKSGSVRFSEFGLNGSASYKNILFSGQLVSVRNPIPKSSKPQLDYAIVDIPFFSGDGNDVGIRLGRPKLPFGLYGSVRDVAAVRPGIFLPDGIYYSSGAARELLYSRNGAQLHWNHYSDDYSLTVEVNWLAKGKIRNIVEHLAFGQDLPGHFELEPNYAARFAVTHFESAITSSLTWVDASASFTGFPLEAKFSQATGSLQLAQEDWVFTTEVMRRELTTSGGRGGIRVAGYLEARRIFSNDWEAFLRYEEFWREIGDRSGREYAAKESRPAHWGYAFETALGVKRNFRNGVSLLAEAHYIDGTGTVDVLSNRGAFTGPPAGRGDSSLLSSSWSYLAVQLAYRF